MRLNGEHVASQFHMALGTTLSNFVSIGLREISVGVRQGFPKTSPPVYILFPWISPLVTGHVCFSVFVLANPRCRLDFMRKQNVHVRGFPLTGWTLVPGNTRLAILALPLGVHRTLSRWPSTPSSPGSPVGHLSNQCH
jgi:hypothetical protein